MNIIKYINNKKNVIVYDLVKNKKIISTYGLENYPTFYNMDSIDNNPFSETQLFIFIIESDKLNNLFFNKTNMLNNTLLFIINNDDFKINSTAYKKLLISHGYKYQKIEDNKITKVFIYDISDYKDNPDWLNSENWANPELWEK